MNRRSDNNAGDGALVRQFQIEVAQFVSHSCTHDQAVNDFATTPPVIKHGHFLAHPHLVDYNFFLIDNDWDRYHRTLGLTDSAVVLGGLLEIW